MRRMQRLARRGKLLGLAPLGQGQGGGVAGPDRFLGPPYYLINDTFTTNRAAGAVNGTDAEPGPGRRVVVDTNGKLSLSNGSVLLASLAPASSNPLLNYSMLSRLAGRLVKFAATSSSGSAPLRCGFVEPGASGVQHTITFLSSFTVTSTSAGVNDPLWGSRTPTIENDYVVVLRDSGAMYFQKATNWLLGWIAMAGSSSPVQPGIASILNGASSSVSFLRIPATLWLPAPIASDGFSSWGTSDGLGHAEGIAGGLGSGGGGLAISSYYGTWGAAGGVAQCSALNSGIGLAGRDVGTADMIATVKVTRSGGVAGLFVRENADDRVMAVHNGTNAQLIKRVSGVETTLINTAATYVAGAELRLICEGTKFRLFYNNVAVGSEQTISDTSLQAETLAGVYTTDTGNSFDDLVVYARGSGGEYAALGDF